MTLETEIEQRLTTIERLVQDRYRDYLAYYCASKQLSFRLTLDENGVVGESSSPADVPSMEQTREAMQRDWQNVWAAVSDLKSAFRSFYVLDVGEDVLHASWRALVGSRRGPGLMAELQRPYSSRSDKQVLRPGGNDVAASTYNYVAYARDIADEVIYNGLLDMHDEPDPDSDELKAESTFWKSSSAQLFFENLVVPFDIAATRQLGYAQALAGYLHGFRLLHGAVSVGVRQIADNCIVALKGEAQPAQPTPIHVDVTAEDILAGVGILASIVGLLLPGANVASVTVGVIGLAASVAPMVMEESKHEDTKPLDVRVTRMADELAQNPMFVIESCQDALVRVHEWIATKDDHLGRSIEADMSHPNSFNSQDLWLREPGGFSDKSFSVKEKEYLQAPISQLRFAGEVKFPQLKGYYEEARKCAESLQLPAWMNHFLPRARADFVAAQGGLVHLLKTTRNNLELWGEELVEVANGLAETDELNAANLRSLTP